MIPAVASTILLCSIARWFANQLAEHQATRRARFGQSTEASSKPIGLVLLVAVVTVRAWIISGISSFVPLFVVHAYHVRAENVWSYSFVFLLFGALGTLAGGPLADRFGQRTIVRFSMFASTPFAVLLPFLPQSLLIIDLAFLGFFLLSTFAVTVVYGQEMMPSNIAMVSGLLIGFAGGVGGIGTFLMGTIADSIGLHEALLWVVLIMPVAALCTLGLPQDAGRRLVPARGGTTAGSVRP